VAEAAPNHQKGIFLQLPRNGEYGECSADGAPHSVHHKLATQYGWGGDIFILCPHHKDRAMYIDAQQDLPIFIIETLCENHFNFHYPEYYAKAKESRDSRDSSWLYGDVSKKVPRRYVTQAERDPGRHIRSKSKKKRRNKFRPVFSERESLIGKIAIWREKVGYNKDDHTDLVLQRLLRRCRRPKKYKVPRIYRA